MTKRVLLLVLTVFPCICIYSYENTYAIIVGVADYENFSRNNGDLRYATNDATKFYQFLMSREGGSVSKDNICLLLNKDASKKNIISKAKNLFSKAKSNDRVIFYYSGHGWKECFMPYDATRDGKKVLYFKDVKKIFRYAKCSTKLLFADACFAGTMKESIIKKQQKSKKNNKEEVNIAVMMSCKGDETSLEMGSLKQGVFTYYLIKGLEGEANRDGNKYITIQELFYYIYQKVKDKTTNGNNKQTPELFGSFDLRLIVANVEVQEKQQISYDKHKYQNRTIIVLIIIAICVVIMVTVIFLIRHIKNNKIQKT